MSTATADQPPATTVAPAAGDTGTLSEGEGRDAAAIDFSEWPERPLSGPTVANRAGHFQVVYHQSALDAIHLHGQTRTDVEVGGVLLGTGYRDAHGPYLLVEHAIAGTAASSRSTNVTFTADTWHQIQTVWDRDFPDKKMVGWYHTHPGFGIFLSGMDVFICDNFFNLPWQIAFVYDPLGGDEGNFVWRDGKPTREPVLLEDDVTPQSSAVPLIPVAEAMTGSDPAAATASPAATTSLAYAAFDGRSVEPPAEAYATRLPVADATRAVLPDDVGAALQSQAIELMARVRLLERRVKGLAFGVLFLAVFVVVCVVTLAWTGVVVAPQQQPPPSVQSMLPSQTVPPTALRPTATTVQPQTDVNARPLNVQSGHSHP